VEGSGDGLRQYPSIFLEGLRKTKNIIRIASLQTMVFARYPEYETNANYSTVTYNLNGGLNLWFHVADILTYLAQTLPVENVCRVLPPGGDNLYHSYVQICQQVGHANHIRALIMATGQQLLTTLNL
jgi:hypothetical protein